MKHQGPTHVVGVRVEEGILDRIDQAVRTSREYRDRSQFLMAALREKLFRDVKDSELQTVGIKKVHHDLRSLDDKLCTFVELFGEFVFAFFMSSPPLPLEDEGKMAAIAILAKRQYRVFLENFLQNMKQGGTGLLERLAAGAVEEKEAINA